METRVVKNVCAPAVVIGDQIIIVGGKGCVSLSLLPPSAQILLYFAAFLLGVLPQKAHGAWEGKDECPSSVHISLGAMEVGTNSPPSTFLLQVAGPGWAETGEKPVQVILLQKKGGSQR